MVKRAVLVGCNYPGESNELQGCVNDVKGMYKMLVGKFGFANEDVMVLVDTESNYPMPTGANIKAALHRMVQGAQPGDIFFFHFSGHGTRIPVDAGEVDDTGFDECIYPSDGNVIDDDFFRELMCMCPGGTTFTIVSDSCQSGGLIDQAKEQIGNSFDQLAMEEVAPDPLAGTDGGSEQRIVKKELSVEEIVQMLRKRSGREDIEVSNLRSTIWEMFGEDASSKMKKQLKGISDTSRSVSQAQPAKNQGKARQKSKVVLKKKKGDSSSSSSDESEDDETADSYDKGSRDINDEIATTYSHVELVTGVDGDVGVLVSGCQSHQTSEDVPADPPHGALSNGIITVLQRLEPGEPITNRQLVMRIRRYLASCGHTQEPGLYCTDEKADQPFICVPVN